MSLSSSFIANPVLLQITVRKAHSFKCGNFREEHLVKHKDVEDNTTDNGK